MLHYISIRFLQSLVALWFVTILVFGLSRISGNPLYTLLPMEATDRDRARMAQVWGLDKPVVQQYWIFLSNTVRGRLGDSLKWRRPAVDLIKDRFPDTLQLAAFSIVIGTLMAVPIGLISAVKRGSAVDYFAKSLALLGQSMPPFWLGLVLMWLFAVKLDLVHSGGKGGLVSFILPGVTLSLFWMAAIVRLLRSSMLDALDSEYVRLARIKGIPEWKVICKHALRNASLVPLTYFGLIIGQLAIGSVSVETVFNWPGLGALSVEAVLVRDYPLVQAIVLFFSVLFIVVNLLVDILYAYLDPRIRYN